MSVFLPHVFYFQDIYAFPLVAIVLNLSRVLNKKVTDVTQADMEGFLSGIRKPCDTVTRLVRDLLMVLCGSNAVAKNTVARYVDSSTTTANFIIV